MKKFLMIALGLGLLTGSIAQGQNLSDRINYVMKKRAAAQRNDTEKADMLSRLIYTDLTIQFQETQARDVFNYLQTVLNVTIVGRYDDDRIGYGIDPETPITLEVENHPALSVIEMILEQCQSIGDECTWQLRNGYVEVGTKQRLSMKAAQEIRYYPIRDLLYEPPIFDNAPELDIGSALNQGRGGGFGGGGGGGVPLAD